MKNKRIKMHRLFRADQFNYQALRTLGHEIYGGALAGEVLTVIGSIKNNDTQSWFNNWYSMGKRCEEFAEKSFDKKSGGYAFLRASNYIRAGEFYMDPRDLRRKDLYNESTDNFNKGIDLLDIKHMVWSITYDNSLMRIYYFPGDDDKPLVLMCGGYDSSNEESYFWGGAAVIERGYPLVMFEGPGQSNMIREYNVCFTHEWDKPLSKVLDFVLQQDKSLQEKKKILFGISFGGLLSGRAAAFEKRIDGVVIFGAPYGLQNVALENMPFLARFCFMKKWKYLFNILASFRIRSSLNNRWMFRNGMWTIGGVDAYSFFNKIEPYTLLDVADKINCDVLVLAGNNDIYASSKQADLYKKTITCARSFRYVSFNEEDGSAEHCQAGAVEQSLNIFFNWLIEMKFCGV